MFKWRPSNHINDRLFPLEIGWELLLFNLIPSTIPAFPANKCKFKGKENKYSSNSHTLIFLSFFKLSEVNSKHF